MTVQKHTQQIFRLYANADKAQELCELQVSDECHCAAEQKAVKQNKGLAPEKSTGHVKKGDMVFKNAILFFHNALLTQEFADAIKCGDSG
jgi:hypothetical protein